MASSSTAPGYGEDPRAIEIETRTVAAFGEMGFKQCNNCIIYQTHMPSPAWASTWGGVTGSVIYANSVYGARSNFEARAVGPGRVHDRTRPRYGFHLDEPRKANVIVRVMLRRVSWRNGSAAWLARSKNGY